MASRRVGTISFPESMIITPAQDNDLNVFKQAWGDKILSRVILGDIYYSNKKHFNGYKRKTQDVQMRTPIKAIKGQTLK